MAKKPLFDSKLAPVGKFHFFRVGDWVHVFVICQPSRDDVVEMLAALGTSKTFNDLPAASKVTMVRGLVEIRAKLSAFDHLKEQKNRERRVSNTLGSGFEMIIESLGKQWGDNAVRLVSGLAGDKGITFQRASARLRKYIEMTRLLRDINESASIESTRSEPQTRSIKQDAETEMLRDLLDKVGIRVIESGSDAYESKGLVLMGLMTGWTSKNVTRPDAMRKRLATLKKRVGKFSGNVA
jgi:hypothetical protein